MEKKRNIYIMISKTGTNCSKIIRLFSAYKYNHVSIALDKDLKFMYSFGRKKLKNPMIAGFIKEDVNGGIYKLYGDTVCQVFSIPVSEKQYLRIKELIEKFENHCDKYGYNFLGLMLMVFNIPLHREYSYVCSQFVAYVLEESDTLKFEKDLSLVRPYDFSNLDGLKLEYSGKLVDY